MKRAHIRIKYKNKEIKEFSDCGRLPYFQFQQVSLSFRKLWANTNKPLYIMGYFFQ